MLFVFESRKNLFLHFIFRYHWWFEFILLPTPIAASASAIQQRGRRAAPTTCEHGMSPHMVSQSTLSSTRSFISRLHSGLSYLFGWLGTCTQLSPPLKEEPVRIIECLLVYRSRHCLCACVDLAQKQHHPVGNVVRHRFESERL